MPMSRISASISRKDRMSRSWCLPWIPAENQSLDQADFAAAERHTSARRPFEKQRPPERPGSQGRPASHPEPQFSRGYAPAPSKNQSFEDKLKQFMSESDSKLSSVRQYSEHRTKTRRR